jgi:hypothetical protein
MPMTSPLMVKDPQVSNAHGNRKLAKDRGSNHPRCRSSGRTRVLFPTLFRHELLRIAHLDTGYLSRTAASRETWREGPESKTHCRHSASSAELFGSHDNRRTGRIDEINVASTAVNMWPPRSLTAASQERTLRAQQAAFRHRLDFLRSRSTAHRLNTNRLRTLTESPRVRRAAPGIRAEAG